MLLLQKSFLAFALSSVGCVSARLTTQKNHAFAVPPQANNDRELIWMGTNVNDANEFPTYVAAGGATNADCGGTIIAKQWILTAAHCSTSVWKIGSKVRIGSIVYGQGGTEVTLASWHPHPTWNAKQDSGADIALVKIQEEWNGVLKPLNTDENNPALSAPVTVIGMGETDDTDNPNQLKKVTLQVEPHANCADSTEFSNNEVICVYGGGNNGPDSCGGDSGGPIFDASGNQIGLSAADTGGDAQCGSDDVRAILTRISFYKTWIDETISCVDSNVNCPPPKVSICFSGQSQVSVEGKGTIAMQDLQVGDSVLTSKGTYSKVYSYGHKEEDSEIEYLQIYATNMEPGKPLEISSEHLIYVQDPVSKIVKIVAAQELQVGSVLITQEQSSPAEILSIRTVTRKGAYSPLTTSGDLLVNGIRASSYVSRDWINYDYISGDMLHDFQHAGTLPVRFYCSLKGGCENETHNTKTGFSPWVHFWFTIEQWLLTLPKVLHALGLLFIVAPVIVMLVLPSKLLSLSTSHTVVNVLAALLGYYLYISENSTKNNNDDASIGGLKNKSEAAVVEN